MWWDNHFSEAFQEHLLNSLFEIIRLGKDFSDHFDVRILGNFSFGNGNYENADWYFNSSLDTGRSQVNGSSVLLRCASKHFPQGYPHIHVIGTSHDLWNGTPGNSFVYGLTISGFGTLTSCNKMVRRYGSDAPMVYLILALHENAHLFWAPDSSRRRDLDYVLGAHCKLTDCALGQVNVVGRPDALTATRSISKRYKKTGSYFCNECTTDIVRGKRSLRK